MNVGSWLLWGFVGTVVLTALLNGSQGLGMTRMNAPYLIGTMFTPNRDRAKFIGVLTAGLPLLPAFHPRMANEQYGPTVVRQLEPPGFLALHYGARTPISIVVAHLMYGAILGGFYVFP